MVLINESLSGTTFIVFMGLAYNILTPAKNLSKSFYSIKKGNAAAERVFEIVNLKETDREKNLKKVDNFKREIKTIRKRRWGNSWK